MTVETFERVLGAHPFFTGFGADHLATVTGCVSNVRFDAGQFLARTGAPADRFYVIREGKVRLETFASGRGTLSVDTIDEGEVLGWSWLFAPYRWHFDARALTPVRALALDGVCLRTKCEKDPVFGYEVLRRFAGVVVQRLEATQLQLMDFYGDRS